MLTQRAASALIPVRYLVDRLRQPRSRADEVRALRRRFLEDDGPPGFEEQAAARELRELRERLARQVGAVESCKTCALGHPLPHGRFAGGHCCGLVTEDAFNPDEVAALRQAGTGPADLRLPVGDHAGCSFRGPTGCSLSVSDRPNLCVRYLCPDLRRELHRRGDPAALAAIEETGARLEAVYLRFLSLRQTRLEAQEEAALRGLSDLG